MAFPDRAIEWYRADVTLVALGEESRYADITNDPGKKVKRLNVEHGDPSATTTLARVPGMVGRGWSLS